VKSFGNWYCSYFSCKGGGVKKSFGAKIFLSMLFIHERHKVQS
jgi:hypothetical protein